MILGIKISFFKKNKKKTQTKPQNLQIDFIQSKAEIAICPPVYIIGFFHKNKVFNWMKQNEDHLVYLLWVLPCS